MRKIILFAISLLFTLSLLSCASVNSDKQSSVEITIYPETAVRGGFLSNIWSDYLVYSDNGGRDKNIMYQIIVDGLDFDYQRGYEYKFKAKKILMSNPPMDVANVKYSIQKLVSTKKVITEQSDEIFEVTIGPRLVKYIPNYPIKYDDSGASIQLNVMLAFQADKKESLVLENIDGFEYEEGYEYVLDVKRTTYPEPYSVKYELVELKSKKDVFVE